MIKVGQLDIFLFDKEGSYFKFVIFFQNKTMLRTQIFSRVGRSLASTRQPLLFTHQSLTDIKLLVCVTENKTSDFQVRNLATSQCLHSSGKTRKQIKDKSAKKDPEKFIELRNKIMAKSHSFQKYSKKPGVKKKLVKGWSGMTLTDLASETDMSVDDLFEAILGMEVNTDWLKDENQELGTKFLIEVATRLHFKLQLVKSPKAEEKEKVDKDARRAPPPEEKSLVPRAPVVTIMGHIDHGKTSLLDYLRKSSIVAGEAGGITQHIGAFSVQLEGLKKKVTIIDTPGHAAFTAMRTRGAVSTDIVILIIDSCEGVLEQTKESLRIIRQARVPFIVAMNKIDKAGSDIGAVAEQLRQEGVLLEDQGGEVG